MGSASIYRPYYYGSYKWDNYLLDIEESMGRNTTELQKQTGLHERSVELADQAVSELRQQNANLVNIRETLELGFEEMRAEFQLGFTTMVDRMDRQIEILSEVSMRLGAIHKTLQSPLITQFEELFKLGCERYRKGLWDKALEAFLKAEEKDEVSFPLQLQMGKLLLYGKNKENDVVNYSEAERHLLLAARFAQAEEHDFPGWNKFCGEANFHAAISEYLLGLDSQRAGQLEAMEQYLRKALDHLSKAVTAWPEFIESVYFQAKCYSLLGRDEEALGSFEILSDRDRRYLAKAKLDNDFQRIEPEVEKVFQGAVAQPGQFARTTQAELEKACAALAWARLALPRDRSTSGEDFRKLDKIERELEVAREQFQSLDVDIVALKRELIQNRNVLETMTSAAFASIRQSLKNDISACETGKSSSADAISALRAQMKLTPGTMLGIVFAIVFYFGFQTALSNIPVQWKQEMGTIHSNAVNVLSLAIIFLWIWLGYRIGKAIQRRSKNQPAISLIKEHEQTAIESDRKLQPLRSQADDLERELREYSEWRTATDSST